jgi:hypothetical protein
VLIITAVSMIDVEPTHNASSHQATTINDQGERRGGSGGHFASRMRHPVLRDRQTTFEAQYSRLHE